MDRAGQAPEEPPGDGRGLSARLAALEEIVARHGGLLTVASAPGAGSTFSVDLPLQPARPEGPAGG